MAPVESSKAPRWERGPPQGQVLSTPGAVRRRLLYDLYLFVVMVVEVSSRHYPTDDIEQFARKQLALTLAQLGIDTNE